MVVHQASSGLLDLPARLLAEEWIPLGDWTAFRGDRLDHRVAVPEIAWRSHLFEDAVTGASEGLQEAMNVWCSIVPW
jgi:hypothetical protein